jgi:hypothetical protein
MAFGGRGIPENVKRSWTAIRDFISAEGSKFSKSLEKSAPLLTGKELPKLIQRAFPITTKRLIVAGKLVKTNPTRQNWGNEDTNPLGPSAACAIPAPDQLNVEYYTTNKGQHWKKSFVGTHGALGGVGWNLNKMGFPSTISKIETDCQTAVAQWMNNGLQSAGLEGVLSPKN